MITLDLKHDLKSLYNPSAHEFSVVQVPPMSFLMIDGQGDPETAPAYQQAIDALYSVAFTLKYSLKHSLVAEYPVMPLEGLWWADDPASFDLGRRDEWKWTMMIMQPDIITQELVAVAQAEAREKKDLPALDKMRFARFDEGLAVQILYIGPYQDEGPTIRKMLEFIETQGRQPAGKHHEIYLGDPRRTAPEKLKTVLRHPMR
jgi:hypothetical protein